MIGFLVGHNFRWYQNIAPCQLSFVISTYWRQIVTWPYVCMLVTSLSDCTLYHMLSHWQHIRGNFVSLYFKWTSSISRGWKYSPHPYHHWQLQPNTSPICRPMLSIWSSTSSKTLIHEVFLDALYHQFYTTRAYTYIT